MLKFSLSCLEDNLLEIILEYIDIYEDIPNLICVNKSLFKEISNSRFWSYHSLDACIYSHCFGCGRRQIQYKHLDNLLRNNQVATLRLHLNLDYLFRCLYSMSKMGSVKTLHIRILNSNESNFLKTNHFEYNSLDSLVVYSWPKTSTIGFYMLLSIVGRNISRLKLSDTSMRGLLPIISEKCVNLKDLTLEDCEDIEFNGVYFHKLTNLELNSCHFNLESSQCHIYSTFPSLSSFSYRYSSFFFNSLDKTLSLKILVNFLPVHLNYLRIKLSASNLNEILTALALQQRELEHLIVELEDAEEDDNHLAINDRNLFTLQLTDIICQNLTKLISLEFYRGFNLNYNQPKVFEKIVQIKSLRIIRIIYEKYFLENLTDLISNDSNIQRITLYMNPSIQSSEEKNSKENSYQLIKKLRSKLPDIEVTLVDEIKD